MALQPLDRPAGSTQVLRFSGALLTDAANLATYPKDNGEVPAASPPNVPVGVRFLLADATALANTARKLPNYVFDDGQPAAVSPSAPFSQVIANVTNASDQLITNRTWAENTYITVEPKDAASAALLTGIDLGGVQVCLDGTASGLGLNSGLPVVIIPMIFTVLPTPQAPCNVDILIEVRHTASR